LQAFALQWFSRRHIAVSICLQLFQGTQIVPMNIVFENKAAGRPAWAIPSLNQAPLVARVKAGTFKNRFAPLGGGANS
jgi:hypothetical protein